MQNQYIFRSTHLKSDDNTKSPLNGYILIFLVFLPSIPIIPIDGLYQPVRSDFILMALHSLVFLMAILKKKRISKTLLLFFLIGPIYILNSASTLVGFVQFLGYVSLFASFHVGLNIYKGGSVQWNIVNLLSFFIYSSMLIHILGMIGLSIGLSLGSETYNILGKYGTFSMPFKFGLFLIMVVFLMSKGIISKGFWLFLLVAICILTSDSRISFICIGIVLFCINTSRFLLLGLLAPIILLFTSSKMTDLFASAQSVGDDSSLLMRVVNFQNYLEWLNDYNFMLGQGALAFLEFGIAYGKPGPLDILGIRLFSEFGVPAILLAFCLFIFFLYRIFDFRHFLAFLSFFVIYGLFNEGIVTLRAGNLFWFVLGIFYGLRMREKEKPLRI